MTDEAYRTEHFGLNERTAQSARDVMDILVGNALAISALDLDTGELRLIKRGIELPQIEADEPMLFSTFNNLLIAQKADSSRGRRRLSARHGALRAADGVLRRGEAGLSAVSAEG